LVLIVFYLVRDIQQARVERSKGGAELVRVGELGTPLFYLAILLLVMYASRTRSATRRGRTQRAAGAAFLAGLFFGMSVATSISDATTLNWALMPLDSAVCCFFALMVHRDVRAIVWRQAVRKEPLMPDRQSQR
jgi:hypothetical protein